MQMGHHTTCTEDYHGEANSPFPQNDLVDPGMLRKFEDEFFGPIRVGDTNQDTLVDLRMNRVNMFKALFEVDIAPMIVKFRQSKRSCHLSKFRDAQKPEPNDADSCVDIGGNEIEPFPTIENVNLPSIDLE